MKDFEKKKEIEEVIGPVSGEQFAQLFNLSRKITDYNADDEAMADPDLERKEAEIDEEGGVAVLFDDEDQEEEEEEDYEIREDTDEEDEGDEREGETAAGGEVQEEDIVIGGEASRQATSKAERDIVSPHSIDGFWVQRQISVIYPDPLTAADKAASVLAILGSESSARDCENQLMGLFDYQSFHVIAKFLENREVIV
jgi:pre-mRNA-splicing helicase BRR2